MIRVILCMGVLMALSVVANAKAATLYTAAHQHASGRVTDPHRFSVIVGYPDQCVQGIQCWTYTKGTRSRNAHWPESWYLHVSGQRARDRVYHAYVMDPRSTGWQRHVAQVCGHRCFLDGMGTSSVTRTVPRLSWTPKQWVKAAALVVRAVVAAGKLALPNSVGHDLIQGMALINAAGGRGSTEAYTPQNARQTLSRGHIWVQEKGNCVLKYHAFLRYEGRGDHFACYLQGMLPWDTGWLR